MSIESIGVQGERRITAQDLQGEIFSQMDGHNFMRMPRNNLMLVDVQKLERTVLDRYPQVKSAVVTKDFPHALLVDVEEHDQIIILCEHVDTSAQNGAQVNDRCIEINEYGQFVQRVDFGNARYVVNPIFRLDAKALTIDHLVDSGDDILVEEEILATLITLQESFPFTIDTQLVGVPLLTFFGSGHVRLETDEGWQVLVDARSDPRITLAVLKAFFAQSQEKDVRRRIVEADVRVAGKVFYKLNDQDKTVEESVGIEEGVEVVNEPQL